MVFKKDWDAQSLLALGRSFWECRVFLSAVELDLFSLLAEEPLTARVAARERGADLRGMTILLDALVAIGLLEKKEDRYRVEPALQSCLTPSGDSTILPMARHAAYLWERWSHLTETVRTGLPAPRPPRQQRSEEEVRAFIGAMAVAGRTTARQTAECLDLSGVRKMLDVGGASGTYTIAFLRSEPEMRATLFDLPEVIPLARERLEEEGLLERVNLVAGDFSENEFPAGHDLVLISAIIHQNSPAQNRDLYGKSFRALNSGGRLIIRDHVMDSSRTKPPAGALFAVNMLVGTEGGGTYTLDEIRADLFASGFRDVRLLRPDERMEGLVEARKE